MSTQSADTDRIAGRSHVLVVAYYFPPMGGSGVQRVAKWCKYLPENGWDVTVLTVEPGAYFAFDEGLLAEVEEAGVRIVRKRSSDPTQAGAGRKQVDFPSEWRRRLFAWVTGLFFIPDNKRGWMKPAMEAFRDIEKKQKIDLVFSSAPPYTSFLLGAAMSQALSVPHVMDYRDDWLDNPRHRYPTSWHRARHLGLERKALATASRVLAINQEIGYRIQSRVPEADIVVLPQGYDPSDLEGTEPASRADGKVRFLYAGMFYDAQQPDVFLKGIAAAIDADPSLRSKLELRFVGLFPDNKMPLVSRLGLDGLVVFTGYLPHAETVLELMSADILWMTIGHQEGEEMISTGKLFEYMGTRKPILALIPPGTARQALSGYGAVKVAGPDDAGRVAQHILDLTKAALQVALPTGNQDWVNTFNRRIQTRLLARLMDGLVQNERV